MKEKKRIVMILEENQIKDKKINQKILIIIIIIIIITTRFMTSIFNFLNFLMIR